MRKLYWMCYLNINDFGIVKLYPYMKEIICPGGNTRHDKEVLVRAMVIGSTETMSLKRNLTRHICTLWQFPNYHVNGEPLGV